MTKMYIQPQISNALFFQMHDPFGEIAYSPSLLLFDEKGDLYYTPILTAGL